MTAHGYDTPEAAAMSTFPPQYVHVVASCSDGRDAYVLLDTGSPGQPYLYGVNCHFRDGLWVEGGSGNAGGWSRTDEHEPLGTISIWDEAPAGADLARVEFEGEIVEVPVVEGVFLTVFFRRPLTDSFSRNVAFRPAGEWKPEDRQWRR